MPDQTLVPSAPVGDAMRGSRTLGVVCVLGAVAFCPWIVNLARALSDHATAYHLPEVKAAFGGLLTVVLALTAVGVVVGRRSWTGRARPDAPGDDLVVAATTALAVLGVATEWFLVLPGAGSLRPADAAYAVGVPVAAAAVIVALRRGDRRSAGIVTVVAAVAVTAGVVVMAMTSAPTLPGVHQRAVWVGLDVAEVIAVALTGVRLLQRRSALVPAVAVAVLFTCDAVINIGVARGHALDLALVMAGVELPVAAAAILIALRSARSGTGPTPLSGSSPGARTGAGADRR